MRAQAGPYRTSEILNACRGVLLSGDSAAAFDAISTDSRDTRPNDLFIPIVGETFDGHDFILPALEAGARGSLVGRDIDRDIPQHLPNHVLIQVQDTLRALTDLASAHRTIHPIPLIAVTGSSGKTTVKEMIAAVLGRSHRPLVSAGNLNNMIGLPMTILNMAPDHTVAVVEAGINRNGEMEHLAAAALPDVAVITTVGPVHLEGLGSVENVAREKFRLVEALPTHGTAVVPAANPYLRPLLGRSRARAVSFGIEEGDFQAVNINPGTQTTFDLVCPAGAYHIKLSVPGLHNVANALAAAAACFAVGVSHQDLTEGLAAFATPLLRMETIELSGKRTLIRDCYNANPQSVSVALEVLSRMSTNGNSLALLADMLELGAESEKLHADVGAKAAGLGISRAVFVGQFGEAFVEGFVRGGGSPSAVEHTADKEEAWNTVRNDLQSFEAILVKGSRAMKMETLAQRIIEEG